MWARLWSAQVKCFGFFAINVLQLPLHLWRLGIHLNFCILPRATVIKDLFCACSRWSMAAGNLPLFVTPIRECEDQQSLKKRKRWRESILKKLQCTQLYFGFYAAEKTMRFYLSHWWPYGDKLHLQMFVSLQDSSVCIPVVQKAAAISGRSIGGTILSAITFVDLQGNWRVCVWSWGKERD